MYNCIKQHTYSYKCCLYVSVEQENDLLVCGDCQTNFPLREITRFIRHKVNKCNKEKENETENFDQNGEGDANGNAIISTKCTSISAPITRKESLEGVSSKSPRLFDLEVKVERGEDVDVKDVKDRFPFKVKQVADAGSNTINSGEAGDQ